MKRLYLAAALSLAALPAWAQQPAPDPIQGFATTWENATVLVVNAANAWAALYRDQKVQLDKAKADLAAAEAQKATLIEWLKAAQAATTK